jgi:polyribonucleotide nucleotidyltransferase
MFKVTKRQVQWGGRTLTLETGKIARQADGAVLATYGETIVLCTVVGQKKAKPDTDFFPLTVNYQEKAFAAGKIPGGFFKREGRPTEKEVLTSRLIDRPIRPLFPDGFFNEVQVVCTLLSHDLPPRSPCRAFPSWGPSRVAAWVISTANTRSTRPRAC